LNGDIYMSQLMPGFDDPELGSQQTFRAIVKALDNPGRLVQIRSKLSAPEDLNPASAAIFLTLSHDKTTVWADLDWSYPIVEWFQFRCGCSIVTEPCMASLALITNPVTMPPLDQFKMGDEEHPDTAATLIVQVGEMPANTVWNPIRSAVRQMTTRSLMGMPANFWDHWLQQSERFPLSVDIFLTCDDVLAALPHSSGQVIKNLPDL
jgi:alpha-D-ribose 1-methylphosphonate 5-triphosphate synthase subunit PhnH